MKLTSPQVPTHANEIDQSDVFNPRLESPKFLMNSEILL